MDVFTTVIIFIFVLIFYLHLAGQYKKSNDLEIYEMDYTNNAELQKICDLKQPVLFQLPPPISPVEPTIDQILNADVIHSPKNMSRNVCVKDMNDYYNINNTDTPPVVGFISLPFSSYDILTKTDTGSRYMTENNEIFLEESGIKKNISKIVEPLLKPQYSAIITNKYDFHNASKNTETPLRYHLDYRRFYIVVKGKIHVKMTLYKNRNSLDAINDYDNYEFYSQLNVWKKNPILENISFLEFDVTEGNVLYVPSYWWYSIKYSNIEPTLLCSCKYNGIVNTISQFPELIKYNIHQYNSHRKYLKKIPPLATHEKENPNNEEPTAEKDGVITHEGQTAVPTDVEGIKKREFDELTGGFKQLKI